MNIGMFIIVFVLIVVGFNVLVVVFFLIFGFECVICNLMKFGVLIENVLFLKNLIVVNIFFFKNFIVFLIFLWFKGICLNVF